MKPILLWPVRFPRSSIAQDLGLPAERFIVIDVEDDRRAYRLEGFDRKAQLLDPYFLASAGPIGQLVRARFSDIVQGRAACVRRCVEMEGGQCPT